uniref:Uncharacterized protein LOC111115761 n=1 Tax=Crassostrea virginica TaxID=6565 RepID=A0A8B8C600_CRAVI|nr:uncharacterized protein LOC111115761 [Crassostrea virginica]
MNGVALLLCCNWAVLLSKTVQGYENLALKKGAWQSNYNYIKAELAVDGLKQNLSVDGGQCAWSFGGRITEWRVDLGKILSIHHIFIQYATANKVWDAYNLHTGLFLGFSVYISNTANKEDGVLCFRDTNYTRATIPNPVNITCPYHGRYVIYYNNRTNPPYPHGYYDVVRTNLCEVEVYGCPTPGYYGENCSTPCPQNCQERHCHITEGTCLGCKLGHKGHKCNQGCPTSGYYGENCSIPCPQSCQEGRCLITEGTRLGSKPGYKGHECHQCRFFCNASKNN